MISTKKPKPKTCPVCKEKYIRIRAIQPCCNKLDCQIEYSAQLSRKRKTVETKEDRKKLNEFLEKNKTLPKFKKEAQTAMNAFIRERDKDLPCISCGRTSVAQWDAGHFIGRGANSTLALHEDNIHKQCSYCNDYLKGNPTPYRINLIKKIGIERVEFLEGPHDPIRRTKQELAGIKEIYKQKLKQLKLAG